MKMLLILFLIVFLCLNFFVNCSRDLPYDPITKDEKDRKNDTFELTIQLYYESTKALATNIQTVSISYSYEGSDTLLASVSYKNTFTVTLPIVRKFHDDLWENITCYEVLISDTLYWYSLHRYRAFPNLTGGEKLIWDIVY